MSNVRVEGSKRRLAFAFFLVVWLLKFILGFISATTQHAYSYPDATRGFPYPYMDDVEFYVAMPAAFAALNLLMLIFASKLPKWLAAIASSLQLLLLLMLLFLGTGGI